MSSSYRFYGFLPVKVEGVMVFGGVLCYVDEGYLGKKSYKNEEGYVVGSFGCPPKRQVQATLRLGTESYSVEEKQTKDLSRRKFFG
ncbi:hypothetical protein L6164_010293 [Bauhinia variegata]|uniref:Uncharacterized protein n=1 Tax=Bauhinia variegata TaxID=167791 RepID=A0ACB9PMT8_BAUVA|nr:hypothetical protein L6164_010293 [Bauhinia variegata]